MRWPMVRLLVLSGMMGAGCSPPPVVPAEPTWADVGPIFRGQCNGCHGWTAPQTGGSYRFDFYDVTEETCGEAAKALDPGVILAGSPLAPPFIHEDVIPQGGSIWARMPPPPSPALPDGERDALERWSAKPERGSAPAHNLPPTLQVQGFPTAVDRSLAFTAVLSDPDADAAIGIIRVNDAAGNELAFLHMNRTGSFAVSFDASTWPAGAVTLDVVVCDGWTKAEYNDFFANVIVSHPTK